MVAMAMDMEGDMVRQTVRDVNRLYRGGDPSEIAQAEAGLVLTDRQRVILQMYYHRGHNVGYVADTLGLSQHTVYNEVAAIRRKLAKRMHADEV